MGLKYIIFALICSSLFSSMVFADASSDQVWWPINESEVWFKEITTYLNDPETNPEMLQTKADRLVNVFLTSESVMEYITNVNRKRLSSVAHVVSRDTFEYLRAPNISTPILESDERLMLKMELLEKSLHEKNKWTRLNHLKTDLKTGGIAALISSLVVNTMMSPFGGWISGNGFFHSFMSGLGEPSTWLVGLTMGGVLAAALRVGKNLTEENSFRGTVTSQMNHWYKYYRKPYMCRRFYRL
jgi:hypothetical protein